MLLYMKEYREHPGDRAALERDAYSHSMGECPAVLSEGYVFASAPGGYPGAHLETIGFTRIDADELAKRKKGDIVAVAGLLGFDTDGTKAELVRSIFDLPAPGPTEEELAAALKEEQDAQAKREAEAAAAIEAEALAALEAEAEAALEAETQSALEAEADAEAEAQAIADAQGDGGDA